MKKLPRFCCRGHELVRFPIALDKWGRAHDANHFNGAYCKIRESVLDGEGADRGLPAIVLAHRDRCQFDGDHFAVWSGRVGTLPQG